MGKTLGGGSLPGHLGSATINESGRRWTVLCTASSTDRLPAPPADNSGIHPSSIPAPQS